MTKFCYDLLVKSLTRGYVLVALFGTSKVYTIRNFLLKLQLSPKPSQVHVTYNPKQYVKSTPTF